MVGYSVMMQHLLCSEDLAQSGRRKYPIRHTSKGEGLSKPLALFGPEALTLKQKIVRRRTPA
jgi:hypothetical protein